jgi:hypothetical protein
MRILFALAALILLGTFAPPSLQRPQRPPAQTWLSFEAVPLQAGDPRTTRVGRLAYVGGWSVTSNDLRVGGISAIDVDRGEVIAFSDAGSRILFPLPRDGRPVRASIDAPAGPKRDRDVESMAVSGDRVWIGLERRNMVVRYDRRSWRSDAAAAPGAMRRWRANRGPEAMLRLPDGRFLVFSEGSGGPSEALLFAGDPALEATPALRLRYRPPRGYRVTDADILPDGRALFLNRRVRLLEGMSAKLTLARLDRLKAGGLIEGEEIAHLQRPMTVDNLEAVSVGREGGRTIVWLASDDNFNPLQRSLLLKFALAE